MSDMQNRAPGCRMKSSWIIRHLGTYKAGHRVTPICSCDDPACACVTFRKETGGIFFFSRVLALAALRPEVLVMVQVLVMTI
jgi:hypothetical protein